jgi:hypothetical protein
MVFNYKVFLTAKFVLSVDMVPLYYRLALLVTRKVGLVSFPITLLPMNLHVFIDSVLAARKCFNRST